MEPFRVHILGCGSALPTLKHNSSAQVVEVRGKLFLVDCGEGTQVLLRRSRISFTKIQAVFISHLHGDHCFGLDFEVVFHAVDTTRHQPIYSDRSLVVESIPLEHRIPCCGFLFREKPLLPHIRRDMIDAYEIPVSHINNIKNGADWTMPDGTLVPNSRLTKPADPPRSYAYCSDTRYIPTLHQLLKNVSLLYHESTYSQEQADRAAQYWHSTAHEAALVARDAGVGCLMLGHYSARYEDEEKLLNEARKVFENTCLSDEGMVFDVK